MLVPSGDFAEFYRAEEADIYAAGLKMPLFAEQYTARRSFVTGETVRLTCETAETAGWDVQVNDGGIITIDYLNPSLKGMKRGEALGNKVAKFLGRVTNNVHTTRYTPLSEGELPKKVDIDKLVQRITDVAINILQQRNERRLVISLQSVKI